MKFRVSCHIEYEVTSPATLLFNIRPRITSSQKVLDESLVFTPEHATELIITEPDHNRFDRIVVRDVQQLQVDYQATVEVQHQVLNPDMLRKTAPHKLDQRELPYLLASRYCQSDRLGRFAWKKFGNISGVYEQVLKITEWIHENVEYLPGTTTSATSAYDTPTECAGVCRDFAHLGIALCRALTIPARYFTGYAWNLNPPDFHACFEAYIGGHWVLFDPTRLASPNGLVNIGAGRDAADVAVCTIFGMARTLNQSVDCQVLDPSFKGLTIEELKDTAISLDTPPNAEA